MQNEAAGCCDGESFAGLLVTAGEGELLCGGETKPVRPGSVCSCRRTPGEWQLRGLVTALLCYLGESIA